MTEPSVFIDTSAFYALMDKSDQYHDEAQALWSSLVLEEISLKTTNYIVVETFALLQNRLGIEAAELWYQDILGLAEILWLESAQHQEAYEQWSNIRKRRLSLVDCVSFVMMYIHRIETVFGFDGHFNEQGFKSYSTP